MKPARTVRLLVGAVCAALAAGLLWVSVSSLRLSYGNSQKQRAAPAEGIAKTCGPEALLVACARLGIPVSDFGMVNCLNPGKEGVSFGQLKQAAAALGCNSRLVTVTFEALTSHNGTAVLWVNGDHFLAVDPREKPQEQNGGSPPIRVYNTNEPAQWWSAEQLQRIWKGETLLLSRTDLSAASLTHGPHLEWADCMQDMGYVTAGDPLQYVFAFRNSGSSDLTLKVIKTGCGCAAAAADKPVYGPGETGQLRMSVNTSAKRGYVHVAAFVESNDPSLPLSTVRAACGVHHDRLTSSDKIWFGGIPRGQRAIQSFYAYDAGKNRLDIKNVRLEFDDSLGTELRATTKLHRIRKSTEAVRAVQTLPVQPGDYAITVEVLPEEGCSAGPFSGRVIVETNQPKTPQGVVVFVGEVLTDVQATPSALVLAADGNTSIEIKTTLTRPEGRSVDVQEVKLASDSVPTLLLEGNRTKYVEGGVELHLTLRTSSPILNTPSHGQLLITFANGDTKTVPILVSR
ncbi:MAG: DUF1573 domain-containing protein [Planctomycetes bacterium]|nr:DUF1573 domain-containing protein [Planctomycetota bacterium]